LATLEGLKLELALSMLMPCVLEYRAAVMLVPARVELLLEHRALNGS
jgi:hypothetical protein